MGADVQKIQSPPSFRLWWGRKESMKIIIYEHQTPSYALENNESSRRICVALKNDADEFIDSFDWKPSTNQIRFYGSSKHYDWNNVPQDKLKLWKTSDLSNYLFFTRDM